MPLPLNVSCFTKIQIGFTFLVLAHPGSPGQRAIKRVCVCGCVGVYYVYILYTVHIHDIHVYGAVVVSILVSNKANVFSYFLSVCCIYVCYIISV